MKHRNDIRLVGIMQVDRRRHLYVLGKTGVGKTSLLQNLITHDIQQGRGVCVIDPHGDLAERITCSIPTGRTNDVIVFDPSDSDFSLSFNPLACPRPGRECDVASGVVTTFKKLYDSWGPRLEDTLRNAAYVTAENGGTLLTLMRLLTDEVYRAKLVANTRNDVARDFWLREFSGWNDRYRTEAVAAIQNKVRPFLLNEKIRAIVSQSRSCSSRVSSSLSAQTTY